jgi:hypothetical protein
MDLPPGVANATAMAVDVHVAEESPSDPFAQVVVVPWRAVAVTCMHVRLVWPVISTDASAPPVTRPYTGRRPLARLLDDPSRRARMGEAGRWGVMERFTWRAVAEQSAAYYAEAARR